MTGFISVNREALLKLTVFRVDGRPEEIDVAIDTGFDDFLTLTKQQITKLGLTRRATIRASLANGSVVFLPVFTVDVLWHKELRAIDVLQTETEPLIGTSLLHGSRVVLEVIDGGLVVISPLH